MNTCTHPHGRRDAPGVGFAVTGTEGAVVPANGRVELQLMPLSLEGRRTRKDVHWPRSRATMRACRCVWALLYSDTRLCISFLCFRLISSTSSLLLSSSRSFFFSSSTSSSFPSSSLLSSQCFCDSSSFSISTLSFSTSSFRRWASSSSWASLFLRKSTTSTSFFSSASGFSCTDLIRDGRHRGRMELPLREDLLLRSVSLDTELNVGPLVDRNRRFIDILRREGINRCCNNSVFMQRASGSPPTPPSLSQICSAGSEPVQSGFRPRRRKEARARRTHLLRLQLVQLSLQLGDVGLQLLLFVLPPLLALGHGGVHLDPELRSEAVLALRPGGVRREEKARRREAPLGAQPALLQDFLLQPVLVGPQGRRFPLLPLALPLRLLLHAGQSRPGLTELLLQTGALRPPGGRGFGVLRLLLVLLLDRRLQPTDLRARELFTSHISPLVLRNNLIRDVSFSETSLVASFSFVLSSSLSLSSSLRSSSPFFLSSLKRVHIYQESFSSSTP
ncbi:hypothetical protein EYF80_020355 [Liparis tanakae]|uniref:Uncharacterized protein n=1 Tax=Liparis tanakae TaxID=230148 RepID=A0A4Z2HWH2_9TELE|nr:hypothetical protein EYF80_020355 [Liparis tanakae]